MRKTQYGNIPKAVLENASKAVSQGMLFEKQVPLMDLIKSL